MKVFVPIILKMAHQLQINQLKISRETPQNVENNESAFDAVVDPLTEFHVPVTSDNNSKVDPNVAYNLPGRKASSSSLFSKIEYNVDHNELPRVHRTLSNQSLISMINKPINKNILTSNSLNFGSFSNISIIPNNCDMNASKSDSTNSPPHNEKYETASNISMSSNITDIPCSIVSSISDADENTYTDKNTIKELNTKIHELQTENEKIKFSLNDLEWKTELKWQENYQNLLREKANCDGQLKTLLTQLDNTLKEKEKLITDIGQSNNKSALFDEHTKLQKKLNTLEKQTSELNSKLILSFNETKQYQSESSKLESENEKLRVTEQELKIEVESKNSVLLGLKNKITEQHIEMQNHIHAKLKLNNHVVSLNNEIESVKKSEKWYSEQLHACQLVKSKLHQQIMTMQSGIISDNQKIESLKSEVTHWKNQCEETRNKAIREKEKLLRRMEMIEADLVEREATYKCTEEGHKIDNVAYNLKKLDETQNEIQNKLLIEEYEEHLDNSNKLIAQKDETIAEQNKEKTDFLIRITTLQKMLNEKELLLQSFENSNNDLEMKCNNYNDMIRTKDNQLLELRNKIVNFEVALHAANKEKEEIDEVIKNVRDDFNKFMKCYNNMKETLEEKTKIINSFECEKQELFMENNWRVCEIEELQQKILNSKGLQAELLELHNSHNELMMEKEKLMEENDQLRDKNQENDNDNEVVKLKESLNLREDQLHNQMKNCELLNTEIVQKENEIDELKTRIKQLEFSCKNENFKSKELKNINIELEMNIKELNKKLDNSNYVIDQFNDLCRSSEMEKYNLSVELESIKKDKIDTVEVINEIKSSNDTSTQTDTVDTDELKINLDNIKIKINDLLENDDESINKLDSDKHDLITIFITINEFLNKIFEIKILRDKKIEINDKVIKTLKNKITILKNLIQDKMSTIEKRCNDTLDNYGETKRKVDYVCRFLKEKQNSSVEIQTDDEKENGEVGGENDNKLKRYDKINRTLLRKLKEELRLRKSSEKVHQELEETYSLAVTEINNLKLANNRIELEYDTLKTRCSEYKEKCDKLNGIILTLEKERGEKSVKETVECDKCGELKRLKDEFYELECKFRMIKDKVFWYEKEINDKEQGITECKKQLFNEKLQTSALKKQVSSIQMCLDNANSLLDKKQIEFSQLKAVCGKLEASKVELVSQLEIEQNHHEECKRKLDENLRLIEETNAKDQLLADEIKMLSCHLHQKNLELSNFDNRLNILENEHAIKINSFESTIGELQNSLSEVQIELEGVRNDKFFLQRLCADLKMSLQGTINQNKVLQERLEALQAETNNLTNKLQLDTSSLSSVDDDYINRLLKESTVIPETPLINLRSCLDSLKTEMAVLQKEVYAKTLNNTL